MCNFTLTKTTNMKYFAAFVIEKCPAFGQQIANTKNITKYKGMSKEDFEKELKDNPTCCWKIEVREI
jgi:hypothetical protein